ncbi:hypothetical protein I3843_15G024200 [Carya illinoinensis]|nr:hypothetical protein I3843_15G024200 [Carya illinoinensis]
MRLNPRRRLRLGVYADPTRTEKMMFRPFPKLHCSERNCFVTLPLPDYPIRKFLDRNRLFRFCCQAAMRQRKVMRQKCRITQNTERTQKENTEKRQRKRNDDEAQRTQKEQRNRTQIGDGAAVQA